MQIVKELVGIILINLGTFMLGWALAAAFTCGLLWGAINCLF
jgi:hypothetical protein